MKDSEGRRYDGWVLRYPEAWGGRLVKYVYDRTRTGAWDNFLGKFELNSQRSRALRKYRRMGFTSVKVRIEEVEG